MPPLLLRIVSYATSRRNRSLRVIAPKVVGAGNLHEISSGLELDFFVLYSSATTLFGNPGQSAYVAANSWLEGLARWRCVNGLPATCML